METVIKIIGGLGLFLIISALLALPTMWLWNWLTPDLFDLKTISFLQAWGINILTGTLFRIDSRGSK